MKNLAKRKNRETLSDGYNRKSLTVRLIKTLTPNQVNQNEVSNIFRTITQCHPYTCNG